MEKQETPESLWRCLEGFMEAVRRRLSRCFPGDIVREAAERGEFYGAELICDGRAFKMGSSDRRRLVWAVAYREAITIVRMRNRRGRTEQLPEWLAAPDPCGESLHHCLLVALEMLPAELREVLNLTVLRGVSCRSLERAMGVPEGRFRRLFIRAIAKLRGLMLQVLENMENGAPQNPPGAFI